MNNRVESTADRRQLTLYGITFLLIYFAQKFASPIEGLPKWVFQTVLARPTADGGFGFGPKEVGAFMGIATLPWMVKAFFGVITDTIPLFGYRRKGWLIASSLVSGFALLGIGLGGLGSYMNLLIAATATSFGLAFSDVICDGLMVETSARVERERALPEGSVNRFLQGRQWTGAFLAVVLGSVSGGVVAAFFSVSVGALIACVLPFGVAVLVVFGISEERRVFDWNVAKTGFLALAVASLYVAYVLGTKQIPKGTWWDVVRPYQPYLNGFITLGLMWGFVKPTRQMYVPMLFIFCWLVVPFNVDSPASQSYWTSHNTAFVAALNDPSNGFLAGVKDLLFSLQLATPEAMAKGGAFAEFYYSTFLQAVAAVAALVTVPLYGRYWKNVPQAEAFTRVCVVSLASLALFLAMTLIPALATPTLVFAACALAGVSGVLILLSVLTYLPPLCPPGKEGATFALFTSLANLGIVLGAHTSGPSIYEAFGGIHTVGEGEATKVVADTPHLGMGWLLFLSILWTVLLLFFARFIAKKPAAA